MKTLILAVVALFAAVSSWAQDGGRLGELDKRVRELEERISKLEAAAAPAASKAEAEKRADSQRALAKERMSKDSEVYSREELQEIESLYQVANQKWQTQDGKDSLKKLIEKFDKANRTGCALLYLGQMSKGKEREDYLQKAIDGFSDCFYGDGVQVGAYARFYLAYHCKESGQKEKAEGLFKEIAGKYHDAIDHKGRLLADMMK